MSERKRGCRVGDRKGGEKEKRRKRGMSVRKHRKCGKRKRRWRR